MDLCRDCQYGKVLGNATRIDMNGLVFKVKPGTIECQCPWQVKQIDCDEDGNKINCSEYAVRWKA